MIDRYTGREDKPDYVWEKFSHIISGKVLDVGADKGGLRKYIADYTSIGFGCDIEIDLEKEPIPYQDDSFDTVLCLDALEHLDNMIEVFDKLCHITKKYLIISLPNPWASFMGMLRSGKQLYKYSFACPKGERHKWFFNAKYAGEFFISRSGMKLSHTLRQEPKLTLKQFILKLLLKIFHKVDNEELWKGNLWIVLKK